MWDNSLTMWDFTHFRHQTAVYLRKYIHLITVFYITFSYYYITYVHLLDILHTDRYIRYKGSN